MKKSYSNEINEGIKDIKNPVVDMYASNFKKDTDPRTLSQSLDVLANGKGNQVRFYKLYILHTTERESMTKDEKMELSDISNYWLFYCDIEFRTQDPELYPILVRLSK